MNSKIHVGLDISDSSIRYAIGRESANSEKKIEILGVNTHFLAASGFNEESVISALQAIVEEILMEFAVQTQIVHLCIPANLTSSMSEGSSKSLLKIVNLADLEIDRIDTVGNAAAESTLLDTEKETCSLFLEIRRNGTHIHFYNKRVVTQYFLDHRSLLSDPGQVDVRALLEQVKQIRVACSLNNVVISGELANDPHLLSLASLIFSVRCRIGIPNLYVESAAGVFNELEFWETTELSEYSAVIGLLLRVHRGISLG